MSTLNDLPISLQFFFVAEQNENLWHEKTFCSAANPFLLYNICEIGTQVQPSVGVYYKELKSSFMSIQL